MPNSIISEGRTTTEAIEKGLKELKVSKDKVEIRVLESEDKRSFFSILAPRIVKVELTMKENVLKETENRKEKEYDRNEQDIETARENVKKFLESFLKKANNSLEYNIKTEEYTIMIEIKGSSAGMLIGYRGETLNALQTILASIADKGMNEKVRLILDIEGYREKRQKILEELAEKVSKTVVKTGKSITLEPMTSYERKIIHSKLQDNKNIKTYSIGENQNRRIVIAKEEEV